MPSYRTPSQPGATPPGPVVAAVQEATTAGEIARLAILWPLAAALPLALGAPPAVAIGGAALVLAAYLRHTLYAPGAARRAARRAALGARRLGPHWPRTLVAVAALLLTATAVHTITESRNEPTTVPGPLDAYATRGPLHAAAVLVVGAGMMPLMEELAFRGALTTALEPRLGARGAIPVVSLAFAAAHLQPAELPALLVAGLLLGALAWGARSVWPAVLAHMLWNALAVAARVRPIAGGAVAAAHPRAHDALLLLASAAAFGWVVLRLRRATTPAAACAARTA